MRTKITRNVLLFTAGALVACAPEVEAELRSGVYRMRGEVVESSCAYDEVTSKGTEFEGYAAIFIDDHRRLSLIRPIVEHVGILEWGSLRREFDPGDATWHDIISFQTPCGSTYTEELFVAQDGDELELSTTIGWSNVTNACENELVVSSDCSVELVLDYRLEEVCEPPCELINNEPGSDPDRPSCVCPEST